MKVSVIIPYNKDRGYLREAIKSVEQQTHPCELILINQQKLRSVNCNDGIKKATGDFIKFLDEDDKLTPDSIKRSLEVFDSGVDFIHGNALTDWGNRTEVYKPKIKQPSFEYILKQNIIHNPTVMYRRSVFEKVGMYDESLSTAEDWDFNLRCLFAGLKIGYVDVILIIYRRHDKQMSIGKGRDDSARKDCLPRIRAKYDNL